MSEYVCTICGGEGHDANDPDRPWWCRKIETLARPVNETTGEPPHGLTLRRWAESLLRHAEDRDGLVWVTKAEVQAVLDAAPSTPAGDGLREALRRIHSYCANGCDLDPDGVRRWRTNAGDDEECLDSIHPAADEIERLLAASQPRNEDGLREALRRIDGFLFDSEREPTDAWDTDMGRIDVLNAIARIILDTVGPVAAQSGEAAGEGEGRG